MKLRHVRISETLYREIQFTKEFHNIKSSKSKKITFQEASDEIGTMLNKLRIKKNNKELPKI